MERLLSGRGYLCTEVVSSFMFARGIVCLTYMQFALYFCYLLTLTSG